MSTSDEQQIRNLITGWATAVHGGDMDGVLVDHSDDIVMFDVPPPHDGVRGSRPTARRGPGSLLASVGASFEIVSLDVIAGD